MSYQDDILTIETPENVAFGFPIAGIGSRFIAALIDTTLIVVLQGLVLLLTALIAFNLFGFSTESIGLGSLGGWVIALLGLVSFLFLWGYYIFFEMLWNGQSPGKRLVGLRVIRTDGTPISISESIIRNLVRLVDFLPSLYGLGVVVMFINPDSRRLGDLAAGTIVVRETGAAIDLGSLAQPDQPAATGAVRLEGIGVLPLERLTQEDIDTIDSFLNRQSQFSSPDVVGKRVLERLMRRMGIEHAFYERWDTVRLLEQIRSALAHKSQGE